MSQMERIPPHNDDAEKSVLGSIFLDKDALFNAMEILRAEDFYSEMHKEIYLAILELYKNSIPVDTITVVEELKKRKSLEMVGGRSYIAYLSTIVPSTENASQYAKMISEKAVLRKLIVTATEIIEKSYQEKMEPDAVLDFAENGIFKIAQGKQKKDFMPLQDILWENINRIDEMSKLEGNITGITTGYIDLDKKTSGFQKSDLIILAARPSMGKTAFALNIAQQTALKGKSKVMIFSLEMSKEQLGQRMLSMESKVEIEKLRRGDIDRKEWEQIHTALDNLGKTEIFIDDTPGINVMEIKNKCRRLKTEKGLDLVIVDYLQLMNFEGKTENRQQEITALSRAFKQLARELECPVLVLSQLSRAPEQRQDHRPVLADLRESGSIEQDADIVMFLFRDEYYTKELTEKPNICDVIIAKQRNGPTDTIELTWIGKHTRFANKSSLNDSK
ncbi:MAG: replicative DNA helicase [Eubacteriales bacterium]